MSEEKPILSQHLFLFPFVVTCKEKSKFDRKDTQELLVKKDGWKESKFAPSKNFSEYVYFHKYVRESAFNDESKTSFSDYYQKDCSAGDRLNIYYSPDKCYELQLEYLSLHIFETGIGILTIQVQNCDYPGLEDVLKINDLARRIYPPYLCDDKPDKPPRGSAIPYKAVLSLGGTTVTEPFQGPYVTDGGELIIGAHIRSILGEYFLDQYKAEPVIDDRMYTLCWYGNDELSGALNSRRRHHYAYEDSDDWYRFVYVDSGDSCCKNIDMRRELISRSTYARWVEYGTLYGISRYSFVALTNSTADFIRNHMQRQYYQMAVFLLAQRASAISFASRISSISSEIDDLNGKTVEIDGIAENVRKLQGDFIGFVNRIWFEEVTPQEQGIELFAIAQSQMKLKEQIAELKEEMKELFEYVEMQYEKKQTENDRELNKVIGLLTKVSVIFLPLSLFSGLWGMNVLNYNSEKKVIEFVNHPWFVPILLAAIILPFIIFKVCLCHSDKKRRNHELSVTG